MRKEKARKRFATRMVVRSKRETEDGRRETRSDKREAINEKREGQTNVCHPERSEGSAENAACADPSHRLRRVRDDRPCT